MRKVSIFCYWGGKIIDDGSEGLSYSKKEFKVVATSRDTNYEQMKQKLYDKIGISLERFSLKLTCRMPSVDRNNCLKYIRMNVDDEDSLDTMFSVTDAPGRIFVELYVEMEEKVEKVNYLNAVESDFDCEEDEMGNHDGHCTPMAPFMTMLGIDKLYDQNTYQNIIYPESWDAENEEPFVGLLFESQELMKQGMKLWSIVRKVNHTTISSKSKFWDIRCKERPACLWRFRACQRKRSGLWEVTVYHGPHTCPHIRTNGNHPQLDSNLIAQIIGPSIANNPSMKVSSIQDIIFAQFGKTISYKKAWSGKQKAIASLLGEQSDIQQSDVQDPDIQQSEVQDPDIQQPRIHQDDTPSFNLHLDSRRDISREVRQLNDNNPGSTSIPTLGPSASGESSSVTGVSIPPQRPTRA